MTKPTRQQRRREEREQAKAELHVSLVLHRGDGKPINPSTIPVEARPNVAKVILQHAGAVCGSRAMLGAVFAEAMAESGYAMAQAQEPKPKIEMATEEEVEHLAAQDRELRKGGGD